MAYTLIEVSSLPPGVDFSVLQTFNSFPSELDVSESLVRDPSLPPFNPELPIYYYVTGVIRPGQKMIFKVYLYQ